MTKKSELVEYQFRADLAKASGLSLHQVDRCLAEIRNLVVSRLMDDSSVSLPSLINIELVKRKPGVGPDRPLRVKARPCTSIELEVNSAGEACA